MVSDHPKRFGFFASLPMPDVDACLREIEYAFDVLKFDGVDIRTSYGMKWLGHADFAPRTEREIELLARPRGRPRQAPLGDSRREGVTLGEAPAAQRPA